MIEYDNYCVYMHINKINNKVYIGQTCQKQTGIKNPNIFRAIKTGGYRWKYYEEEIA